MFDIYVNSSLSEAMCLGILESMSAGVSVVATNVGDTAELIGGDDPCGLTVPAGDPHAFASAVDTLLGDQTLRKKLGGNGVRRHAARYSVDRMVADYANLYLELSVQNR
jgi:glycosyltransferase involved in cell wall biosynthesis